MHERGDRSGNVSFSPAPGIRVNALAIGVLLACIWLPTCPAQAQCAYDLDSKYALIDLYQQARDDSAKVQMTVGFTYGVPLGNTRFVYELQRPMITYFKFPDRLDTERVASTPLVMGTLMGSMAWTMVALGYDDDQINNTVPYIMAPFGSHIGYRATRWLTLYGGVIPEVILFTENDGILAQGRLGLRIDGRVGLTFSGGIQKTGYWGWETPSRTLPPGFFLGISYASPRGGPLMK